MFDGWKFITRNYLLRSSQSVSMMFTICFTKTFKAIKYFILLSIMDLQLLYHRKNVHFCIFWAQFFLSHYVGCDEQTWTGLLTSALTNTFYFLVDTMHILLKNKCVMRRVPEVHTDLTGRLQKNKWCNLFRLHVLYISTSAWMLLTVEIFIFSNID